MLKWRHVRSDNAMSKVWLTGLRPIAAGLSDKIAALENE
jgi:hypothetical protein